MGGTKPSYKCKTNFITTNGKGCKGACEPSDGKDMRTFEEAKKFRASIGMRLPSNEVELKRSQGTGCNFNGKEIWFDKKQGAVYSNHNRDSFRTKSARLCARRAYCLK